MKVHEGPGRRVVVDAENPWPGLDYFGEGSQEFFHGRETESDLLLSMVRHRLLTVLYGQSGLGKSSLLQAGLFPRLRADGWLPVYVRLSHTDADGLGGKGPQALVAQAKQFIREAITEAIEEGQLLEQGDQSPMPREDESLWEYLHRRDSGLRSAARERVAPVLVFDQFEEIFTLGRSESRLAIRQTFLRDLADCVENRLPEYVLKEMNRRERDGDPFAHLEFTRQDYRVVLSLREDYLAELHDLDELMPSIHENETRLLPLNGWQALDAVAIPGESLVEPFVAREIVELVAASRRGDVDQDGAAAAGKDGAALDEAQLQVDPALLSMVCRELNIERQRRGLSKITQEVIDDLLRNSERSILRRFYAECFRSLPDQESAARVQKFIEDELLTPTGYRNMAELERAEHRLAAAGVREPADAFQRLVDERLLRVSERRQDKTRWLELTHDVLCEVVKESRHEREVREAKERQEREESERAAQRLREAEEQRARAEAETRVAREREADALARLQQMRRVRRLGIAAMILSVGLVGALAVAGLLAKSWYEAGKKGQERSRATTGYANARIARGEDERGNVNALRLLARALRLDPNNAEAARLTCELLMKKDWLPPLSLPLRYTEVPLLCAGFSPDGRWIVAVAQDGSLIQWDAETYEQASRPLQLLPDKKPSPELVTSAAFSRDGKRILLTLAPTGRENARVCNWSEEDRAYKADVATIEFKESIRALAWSADGASLFVLPQRFTDTTCRVFRFEDTRFKEKGPIINTIAVDLSPDGRWLATAEPGGKVFLRDAETLQPVAAGGEVQPVLEPPSASIETRYTSLLFSENGEELAATSIREPARVWNLRSGQGKLVRPGSAQDRIMRVAFAPKGKGQDALALAIAGTMGGVVTLVDPARPEQRLAEPICFTEGFVFPSFRADGKVLVTLSGAFWQAMDTVRLWDASLRKAPADSAPHRFTGKNAPAWLSDLADTIAGVLPHRDDKEWAVWTLSALKKKYDGERGPNEYAPVWDRYLATAR